jgi:gas vesicle protein
MGQEPEAIRDEIEQTRERMTETVDALGYKADVKARAGDYVSDKKEALAGRMHGVAEATDSLVSRVSGAVPDPHAMRQDAGAGTRRAASAAQSNPLGLAVGAVAVGFLVGMLLPSTRVENERIGEIADDVKARVKDTGEEAIEHGKEVAQETAQVAMEGARDAAQTAIEAARQSGQEHAEELKETARGHVEDVRGAGGDTTTSQAPPVGGVGELEEHGPVGGPMPVRPDHR